MRDWNIQGVRDKLDDIANETERLKVIVKLQEKHIMELEAELTRTQAAYNAACREGTKAKNELAHLTYLTEAKGRT